MPLNSQSNPYQQVPQALISRSSFDRSHSVRFTCDSGYLVPCFRDEILPGDTIDLQATIFARLATQIVPILDNAYVEFHLWFIPNRLVWDNWQKFMGERRNPGDSIDYLNPTVTTPFNVDNGDGTQHNGVLPGSLLDYLGVRPNIGGLTIDAKYPRAYQLVYNEWYRDENLINSIYCPTDDGPDDVSQYVLQRRGKRGDYFTNGFTQPQKGPNVALSIGDKAPVVGNGLTTGLTSAQEGNLGFNLFATGEQGFVALNAQSGNMGTPVGAVSSGYNATPGHTVGVTTNPNLSGLVADLSLAYGATVNSLRDAIALQQFLEADMMGGTRYIEQVFQHFGVVSPDARLQRPEFLGSFSANLNQTTVAQTSQTTQGTNASPQANLSAYSTFAGAGNSIKHSFTEHGILLGLLNIRADLTYQYGLDRELSRRTRYDYFWPDFQHLGMQPVYNKEIFADASSADDQVFNYQMRYDEYRYKPSRVAGLLRSGVQDAHGNNVSLDYWTLAQDFKNSQGQIVRPAFNKDFIEEHPPFKRVIAVQNQPEFIVDCDFEYYHTRPMAVYGMPGLTRL